MTGRSDEGDADPSGPSRFLRRAFLAGAAGTGAAALSLRGRALVPGDGELPPDWRFGDGTERESDRGYPRDAPGGVDRPWLGPRYWGNRLQDWRCRDGRIECVRGERSYEVRTVSVLTKEVVRGDAPAHLRVVTRLEEDLGGGGFCGFLVGTGTERSGYRSRALVQRGSGTGGGTLCTFETDGRVRFREHTDGDRPLAFAKLPADANAAAAGPRRPSVGQRVALSLDVLPRGDGEFDLRLRARDVRSGELLAGAVRRGVPESALVGGVAFVSSPSPNRAGARWSFERFRAHGGKVATHPDRTFGPIAGTLYSLDGRVLKLTTQLLPVDAPSERTVEFQYRPAGSDGPWRRGPRSMVERGYVARFRLDDWSPNRAWEYRVAFEDATGRTWHYRGRIRRDTADAEEMRVGLFSCTVASARKLEAGTPDPEVPSARPLGRFAPENVYFPHLELAANAGAHDPDLLVFTGDQLYETSPTRSENAVDPGLDYLYKWLLWTWSFRDLTRERPSIVLVDDHDVYQPNVWGEGGEKAPRSEWVDGGFIGETEFLNCVQRVQCGHNPDPYDPTPAERGVSVYYGSFRYGGADFVLLEDRKFKSAPPPHEDVEGGRLSLLGERQERFLRRWGRRVDDDSATICLTQTCFACPQTTPDGRPNRDYDSNGFPKPGRDRAIRLLRDAGALVLSGDQHLASLVRHGVDGHTDGVVQFSGPAGGALFQRWFEPARPLPNGRAGPNTGDYTDAFGNPFRMLAVANPKVSFDEYRDHERTKQTLGDRRLKREGYGLVRVNRRREAYTVECWPWDANPTDDDATQFAGWPYRLPFGEADGR